MFEEVRRQSPCYVCVSMERNLLGPDPRRLTASRGSFLALLEENYRSVGQKRAAFGVRRSLSTCVFDSASGSLWRVAA